MPDIDPHKSIEKQKSFYERKYGLVFLDDEWSLWHIRVWLNAREPSFGGVTIDRETIWRYADKWGMDDIETLEMIKLIEREAGNGEKS